MLEDLFEVICEMIFEGIFDKATSKTTSVWLRIIFITVVVGFCLFMFVVGMKEQDDGLIVLSLLLIGLVAFAFISARNKYRK